MWSSGATSVYLMFVSDLIKLIYKTLSVSQASWLLGNESLVMWIWHHCHQLTNWHIDLFRHIPLRLKTNTLLFLESFSFHQFSENETTELNKKMGLVNECRETQWEDGPSIPILSMYFIFIYLFNYYTKWISNWKHQSVNRSLAFHCTFCCKTHTSWI